MIKEKDLYQELLDAGYAKHEIHNTLHKLMMLIIKNKQVDVVHKEILSLNTNYNMMNRIIVQRLIKE